MQASLIATILSNGSTAESIVKASWEATRAARHNSSVACSNPIPLVLSTPHSMVAILRKFSNYKTMVSGCFWEVFNNRGKGLFPWHVAHLANYWVMHQIISKTWCPIAHRKQNWIPWMIYGPFMDVHPSKSMDAYRICSCYVEPSSKIWFRETLQDTSIFGA